MADKRAKKLVIDSNAFIKGVRLETIGEDFWTVPQVISEVRDVKAREFLDTFPFKIQTREPTPAALKAVAEFARKTGDYAFLSAVDMRVLALAYTLESEAKGTAHLRTQPLKPGQEINPSSNDDANEEDEDEEEEVNEEEENDENDQTTNENDQPNNENNQNNNHVHENKEQTTPQNDKKDENNDATTATTPQQQDEDDGWITPSNIGSVRARRGKEDDIQAEKVEVGCFTTDYAMQSVLLQMGLKLLSVDGMVIKRIRQYVLKCHACFKICKDMEKKFCPSCGNTTLLRFSVSTDDQGNLQYTQAQRLTNRGSIYSIPMPKGGKHNKDIILVEDQYLQKTKYRKDARETDVFGSDYAFAQTKTGPAQNVVIGFGKKNPNVAKRRIGKKNKPISALQ